MTLRYRKMKYQAYILLVAVLLLVSSAAKAQDMQDLVHQCATSAGNDATYLKDFVVKLEGMGPDKRPPVYRESLALRKNVIYRFSICKMDASLGEPVLRVYDQAKMILSTYYPESGKEYESINFLCKKSGIYTIVISFKDGKSGEAIGILSYVNK